ncbi:MAG: hypothetical protein BM557_00335 [Flavobacterium sp. MedPE-SWcel]|uniref:Crp/Fnr family transcriptional regulator n=1 Tax=uncultured Flavobacterium sp. TaxID=165435 RepID=UPI000918997E|nr:Crp/Fnr family transcriptional regulator [uncultured Flavobacterium sp.]OIQ22469.1 MAG: hypothetical protein BM557_00335 [Flavobacterium sp. MedPE-SWcel]
MNVTTELLSRIDDYHLPLWEEKEVIIKRGEVLHNQGNINTNIYYVLEGALHLYHETETDSNTIRFGYKDSIFALLDSFLTNKPSAYTAQAIRKTRLRVMNKESFMEFIYSDMENIKLWNEILSYVVTAQLERETDLLASLPQERYESVLKRSPQLFKEIPHRYIASYLRMAPETLSRLQKS